MIELVEFLGIFSENTDFSVKELIRFYRSVKKIVALSYAGKKGLPLLIRVDQKDQWPVLKRMDNPSLSIYKEADDQELLQAFIQTIKDQKKKNSWITLQESIRKRASLYVKILCLTPEEVEKCKLLGQKMEKKLIRRDSRRRLAIGVGTGITAAGAIGTGIYFLKKAKGKEK